MTPDAAVAHLAPDLWGQANRQLVGKCLAEFAHELLVQPRSLDGRGYVVDSDDGETEYRYLAYRSGLDHWLVDADSIVRQRDGDTLPLDAVDFVLDLRFTLGLADEILPVYLEEIGSTLSSMAYRLSQPYLDAAELSRADFQVVETRMTEGHPCFVANSARLGFDAAEYRAYAPEAATPLRLLWLAVWRECSVFTSADDVDHDELMRSELGDAALDRFGGVLAELGLSFDDYHLLPVHPWQWWNKLTVTFAGEVARRNIVCLGYGDDHYLPQQSVRTFFNVTDPGKHYVKTALSVLNMGFMRGLSARYMAGTPAINDWLARLVADDKVLRRAGFSILRERAAIGYRHRQYEAGAPAGSPYLKMLAALWRESPVPRLGAGERLVTMASLLHVDRDGGSLASALIADSRLAPTVWLRRYLDAYLVPVLHSFYAYQLVYMPHGENVILVLDERSVPRRVFFKDIAEEIAVMDPSAALPEAVERVRVDVPDDERLLPIFTDVFDSFFRFLGAILACDETLDERAFWVTVAECVVDYQASVPELAGEFVRFDIFADTFARSCLNRLQLRDNQQMVDLADPQAALQFVGTLANPIARHRPTA